MGSESENGKEIWSENESDMGSGNGYWQEVEIWSENGMEI